MASWYIHCDNRATPAHLNGMRTQPLHKAPRQQSLHGVGQGATSHQRRRSGPRPRLLPEDKSVLTAFIASHPGVGVRSLAKLLPEAGLPMLHYTTLQRTLVRLGFSALVQSHWINKDDVGHGQPASVSKCDTCRGLFGPVAPYAPAQTPNVGRTQRDTCRVGTASHFGCACHFDSPVQIDATCVYGRCTKRYTRGDLNMHLPRDEQSCNKGSELSMAPGDATLGH